MAISINAASQDFGGDAILTDLEAGTFNIYGGTAPADAKAAQTNNAIATGTTPNFNAHSGNAGADMASTAALTGTVDAGAGTAATHFRLTSVTGVIQGTVTATGGGGDITLDNVNIADGQTVNITSLTFTMPAA